MRPVARSRLARIGVVIGCFAALGAAGWWLLPSLLIRLPGLLAPRVGPPREVVWQPGPESASQPPGERPPNIVVILADDLGWNDLTFAGGGVAGGSVPTPNIDGIARAGVSFSNAYAAQATCAPSRAAIMTGRYPTRSGFEFTPAGVPFMRGIAYFYRNQQPPPIYYKDREAGYPSREDQGLPPSEITLAELLRERGYHTLHLGKWHLGESPPFRPEAQGFDESLGFYAGGSMFLPENDPDVVNSKQDFDPIDRFLWANLPFGVRLNGSDPFRPSAYMTDYLADEAVAAIRANRHRPFFLYLAFNAPHTPLQALRADYDALGQIENHTERVYGAMIANLDRAVGRVLEALRAQGLEENTLVFFTSDNGGANYVGLPALNQPYRGWKMTFFEGGVHMPFFVKWPRALPKGVTASAPVAHFDIFSTAAAAASAQPPQDRVIDGVNLIPFADGSAKGEPHAALYWRSGDYRAVRAGDWKLQLSQRPPMTWLFDLASDPTERVNRAASEPERVAQLTALLDAHDAQMSRPLWPSLIEGVIRIDEPVNAPQTSHDEYVYWAN
jgi:arylsulfatase A-like enzyme